MMDFSDPFSESPGVHGSVDNSSSIRSLRSILLRALARQRRSRFVQPNQFLSLLPERRGVKFFGRYHASAAHNFKLRLQRFQGMTLDDRVSDFLFGPQPALPNVGPSAVYDVPVLHSGLEA